MLNNNEKGFKEDPVLEEIVLTWEITQGYSCELEVLVLVGKTLSHPESIREVPIP